MDGDKVISANDFVKSLVGFLGLAELEKDFEMYYQTLPQPLNEFNFGVVYGPYLVNQYETPQENKKPLQSIKNLLNENTQKLDNSQNDSFSVQSKGQN